jgi:hypothetical protein
MLAWSGLVVVGFAQMKVSTPEDLDKTMKKVGPASRAVPKAIASGDFAEVKTQLGIMRQGLIDAESFWVEHKRQDAVDFNKTAVAKLDAYIKVASATPVDPAAVEAAGRELGPACSACHKVYRSQDAEKNYIIKPGSLGGN